MWGMAMFRTMLRRLRGYQRQMKLRIVLILSMEEILHLLIWVNLPLFYRGFIHPRWLFGISSTVSSCQFTLGEQGDRSCQLGGRCFLFAAATQFGWKFKTGNANASTNDSNHARELCWTWGTHYHYFKISQLYCFRGYFHKKRLQNKGIRDWLPLKKFLKLEKLQAKLQHPFPWNGRRCGPFFGSRQFVSTFSDIWKTFLNYFFCLAEFAALRGIGGSLS